MLFEKPDVGDLFNIHSLLDNGSASSSNTSSEMRDTVQNKPAEAPWS